MTSGQIWAIIILLAIAGTYYYFFEKNILPQRRRIIQKLSDAKNGVHFSTLCSISTIKLTLDLGRPSDLYIFDDCIIVILKSTWPIFKNNVLFINTCVIVKEDMLLKHENPTQFNLKDFDTVGELFEFDSSKDNKIIIHSTETTKFPWTKNQFSGVETAFYTFQNINKQKIIDRLKTNQPDLTTWF